MNTARAPEGAKIGWIGLGKMGLRPRRWASLASAACGDDHDHRGHDCGTMSTVAISKAEELRISCFCAVLHRAARASLNQS